jgi:hypothetical protein
MGRRTGKTILLLVGLAAGGLFNYELNAKSAGFLGLSLPGWQKARQAEQMVPWQPRTGLLTLDRFLHEAEEALAFYGLIPKRPTPGPVLPLFQIPQKS